MPSEPAEFEEVIKKSRFISYLYPVNNAAEAKAIIQQVKDQHPQARHHCSAFVAGRPSDSNQLGFSDDGEPSGTAGKPMLAVLQGSGLGHIVAVVVRYSGGIKLGTGGLVKAYGGGVKQALTLLPTKLFIPMQQYQLQCSYTHWQQIQFWLQSLDSQVLNVDYQTDIRLSVALSDNAFATLSGQLKDLQLSLVKND